MAYIFIGDYNFGGNSIPGADSEVGAVNGSDKLFRSYSARYATDRKNVDPQLVILKKLCNRIQLILPFVKRRNRGVGGRPTVRGEETLLSRDIKQRRVFPLHMASVAGLLIANV